MSSPAPPHGPPRGPPYPPQNASLGGLPSTLPDIPACAVFLVLYLVLGAAHMKILQGNKARKYRFRFSGALFGFCLVRVMTMTLRIAWAQDTRSVRLGIAAQVFVYAGTIILYIVNWFFAQRVVRATHPRFGWSKQYRIIFRAAIGCIILSLILLVIGAIQQFFTLNKNTLRIDRSLQLVGQTYFSILCFAPVVVVSLSLIIPRKGIDKFGAGRFRNNVAILLIAATILSIGQIFRLASAYIPPTPLRSAQGKPLKEPWYYSKACFYIFNFTTEFIVIFLYAILRIDLRFHIPDGSKQAGDYSSISSKLLSTKRSSYTIRVVGQEKNLKRFSAASTQSNETMHQYEGSIFEDTQTLADSLRYPSTFLEIDENSGTWKVKRASRTSSVISRHTGVAPSNTSQSNLSQYSSTWDSVNQTWVDEAPPVPMPQADWPLRQSQILSGSSQGPPLEQRKGKSGSPHGSSRLAMEYTGTEDDAVSVAHAKLEGHTAPRPPPQVPPPAYEAISIQKNHKSAHSTKGWNTHRNSGPSSPEAPSVPPKHKRRSGVAATPSSDLPSSQPKSRPNSQGRPRSKLQKKRKSVPAVEPAVVAPQLSRGDSTSTATEREAEREFARFSFEASPRDDKFDKELL